MAYTTIDDPTIYFNTKLYTGNGTAIGSGGNAITGVGFQPDWVWIKSRTQAEEHEVFDAVRGVTKYIRPSTTAAEVTDSESLTAFGADGFTVGDHGQINANSQSFVSWNWKAGTSFSNDASATGVGTIDSTGSINTTAGFSIISYSGTGTAGTIAHGLGSTPKMIIVKVRNFVTNWIVHHGSIASTKVLHIDTTNAETTNDAFNDTLPTSSVFSVKTANGINASGKTYIAYCFAEKKGYSKFGKYTGNGNADGTFVYTGFLPAFVLLKRTDSDNWWHIFDNKRDAFNLTDTVLYPNKNNAESTIILGDMLSNGFKLRQTDADVNLSGSPYIYMAFAESPFTNSNGVPNNAR